MSYKNCCIMLSVVVCAMFLFWDNNAFSQNLIDNGDLLRGKSNWQGATTEIVSHEGMSMLVMTSKTPQLSSLKNINIDPKKTYRLSAVFFSESPVKVTVLFGVIPIGTSGKNIHTSDVSFAEESVSHLQEACAKGQEKVLIAKAPGWEKKFASYIAFYPKGIVDSPCDHVLAVSEIKPVDSGIELTLQSPSPWDFPANTPVRRHLPGNTYLYCGGIITNLSGKKELSGTISGISNSTNATKQWRPGTVSARVVVLSIFPPNSKDKLLVGDLKFEEVPPSIED